MRSVGRLLVSARSKRKLALIRHLSLDRLRLSACLIPALAYAHPSRLVCSVKYISLLLSPSRPNHSPSTCLLAPAGSRKEMYTYESDTRHDHNMCGVEAVGRWLAWGLYISRSSFVHVVLCQYKFA